MIPFLLSLPDPTVINESTLSLDYIGYLRAVADYMGNPRNVSEWGDILDAESDYWLFDDIVNVALLDFYSREDWSILRPTATLTTVADTGDYTMPANFGSMLGGTMTYTVTQSQMTIHGTSQGVIDRKRQQDNTSSDPQLFALVPIIGDGTTGQRWLIMFWPVPSTVLSLVYQFTAHPCRINIYNRYPLGGMRMSRVIRQACLAEAESRGPGRGEQTDLYERMILDAKEDDRMTNVPATLGRMQDPGVEELQFSDRLHRHRYEYGVDATYSE